MRSGSKREYVKLVLSRGHENAADESAVGPKSLKAVALETLGTGIIVDFPGVCKKIQALRRV